MASSNRAARKVRCDRCGKTVYYKAMQKHIRNDHRKI